MTIHATFPGPAPGARTRSRKPLPVRQRFKDAAPTAAPEPALPPPVEHLDRHVGGLGRQRYDAAGSADRDGHPLAALIRLRQELADAIEAAIAFLDSTEGDYDVADDAEPTDWEIQQAERRYTLSTDDDEDGADGEPWLGWTRTGAIGDTLDLEISEA